MPFAVHLFFDANTEAAIKPIWKKLADTGIAPYMHESANRPHLTLAIYQHIDLPECERRLKSFAATKSPLPVVFQHLGVFPTTQAAVFLGPTVTVALLELQAEIHETLRSIGSDPHPYYLPGNWVPHCALALELDPKLIIPVLDCVLPLTRPLYGTITEIGVIEFRPVRHLFWFPWGDKAVNGSQYNS